MQQSHDCKNDGCLGNGYARNPLDEPVFQFHEITPGGKLSSGNH